MNAIIPDSLVQCTKDIMLEFIKKEKISTVVKCTVGLHSKMFM